MSSVPLSTPAKPVKAGCHVAYNSIDNYKPALTKALEPFADLEWVAREKIHGANFCLSYRGDKLKAGRRHGWLGETENFHGHQKLMDMYRDGMTQLWDLIGNRDCDVYFEIFGGGYPGHKSLTKPVQPEIYYSPDYHIMAFDIKVGGEYLDDDEMKTLLDRVHIPVAPEIARGTLAFILSHVDVNTLASWHAPGLTPIPGSIAEGVVIKPVQVKRFTTGSRVVLKVKSDRFKELHGKKKKPSEKLSPLQSLLDATRDAIKEHRYRSVLAKLSEDEMESKELVISHLRDDVLKHLEEFEPELMAVCVKGENTMGQFNKKLLGTCRGFVTKMDYEDSKVDELAGAMDELEIAETEPEEIKPRLERRNAIVGVQAVNYDLDEKHSEANEKLGPNHSYAVGDKVWCGVIAPAVYIVLELLGPDRLYVQLDGGLMGSNEHHSELTPYKAE
jgi:Rnl2 family RNA ligase